MFRYKERVIPIVSPASQVGVAAPAILFRLGGNRELRDIYLLLLRRKMLDDRRELFVSDYKDQVVVVVLGSLTSTRNMKNRQIKLNSGKAKKSVFHPLHLCFISDHCCLL